MSTLRSKLIANTALVLFSVSFALLAAELAARIVWGPPASNVHHHRLLCEYDPLLGWRKIANARKRYVTPEYDIEETINAKGLRGPEFPYEKAAGVLRILVLGDSFVEGYTVEEPKVFTAVMKESLEARLGRPVEVINGGTGGYSTDQELLFFRSEGKKYRADVVVLALCDNDIWFNARTESNESTKPLFRLEHAELVLTNTPVPEPAPRIGPESQPTSAMERVKRGIADHVALYGVMRDRLKNTPWTYQAAIWLHLAEPPDAGEPIVPVPDQWQVFRRAPSDSVSDAWKLTEALLRSLRAEVEAEGARLVVVNLPPSFDLYPDRWRAFERQHGIGDGDWSPSLVTERVAEIAGRNRIDLLDLTPTFAAAIEQGLDRPDPLFFPIDGHWTAKGHRLVGVTVADHLAAGRAP